MPGGDVFFDFFEISIFVLFKFSSWRLLLPRVLLQELVYTFVFIPGAEKGTALVPAFLVFKIFFLLGD